MKTLQSALAVALASFLAGCASAPQAARFEVPQSQDASKREAALLSTLQSPEAGLKEKSDACRELARVGSARSVPVLAGLLSDPQLWHMALYALEPIPGQEVDQALREALPRLEGRAQLGAITSLGVRRDPAAVPILQPYLASQDPDVYRAAALALGDIGTPSAVRALQTAFATAEGQRRLDIAEGLLRAAERRLGERDRRAAAQIYDLLRQQPDAPAQVLAAAWRGAILVRGPKDTSLLTQALGSGDLVVAMAGLRAAMEMPDAAITRALAGALPAAQPERQVLLLQTLAVRGDLGALPALLQATNSPDRTVRLTALSALGELGHPRAAEPLLAWITHSDPECREAARSALASLPGASVDQLILSLLDRSEPTSQLAALDLVSRRRLAAALPRLTRLASADNAEIRRAAIKQIGELGALQHWNALLELSRKLSAPDDLAAVRDALLSLAERVEASAAQTEAVLTTLNGASPAQAAVLYHLLAQLGGTKPLRVTANTARSGPPELQAAAFQALLQWRTPDVAEELLWFAQQAPEANRRQDALRRYLQWASDPELSEERRLAMCRQAHRIVQDPAGHKQLLAALSTLATAEVIPMARPLLESPETREEACAAIVTVADRLRKRPGNPPLPESVLAALDAVAQTTQNAELAKRARALRQSGG